VLALAHSAEAKIVYTATNVRLITGQNVYLDLNHDGTNDFYFVGQQSEKTSSGFAFLAISPEPGPKRNAVLTVQSNGNQCAAELPAGEQVGAGRPFKAKSLAMFFRSWGWTGGTSRCGWAKKPGPHYLGLMFRVKGTIHYGWARVKVASYPHYSATLTGYAYETIANKSIITGKTKGPDDASVEAPNASQIAPTDTPATLGMLALGAPTLSVWRREKLVGTND
jgi:hypothetical protein